MPFLLDPALHGDFKDKICSFEFIDLTLYEIAEKIHFKTGLEYDIRFGCVIFSSVKRLYGVYLEHESFIDSQQGIKAEVKAALFKNVNFDPYAMTPAEILKSIFRQDEFAGNIEIEINNSANILKGKPMAPRFDRVRLIDILKFFSRSYGDYLSVECNKIKISSFPGRDLTEKSLSKF